MANYCLDSNVVSDILRRQPEVMRHLNEALDNDDNLFISSIVYYEVVRGLKARAKRACSRNLMIFMLTQNICILTKTI